MNTTAGWNPFKELEDLEKRMVSAFGRRPVRSDNKDEEMTTAQWASLVDILEDDAEFLIKVELPEVNKKDVKVKVDNGVLPRNCIRTIPAWKANLSLSCRRLTAC